ncbi:MAG TPA: hypothetical protein VFD83_00530 [Candidatus Polarisedimenticolia bacterium]|nr:hypothetical protein [Candidatus Polarisedimenticolia bacterium]
MAGLAQRLLNLDRRWLFLLVFLGVAIPILFPIGLPVTTTASTRAAFDFVEALRPGDTVLLSYDYGPSSAPENDPMADGFLRQCFTRKIRVIVIALYPLGGLTLANNSVARVTTEFPNLRYGEDYVNLGYKDGAAAVLRSLDKGFAGPFPVDVRGTPIARIPLMHDVRSVRDVKVVYTVATGIIGEWWITQMHPQSGTPVIIGPTAVSAPKYYAYLNAGQVVGMVGGMKGAAEYEKLMAAKHPELAQFYKSTRGFTATKGMDGQTVIHVVIILFIIVGNVAFARTRMGRRS